ncbi:MAG: M10 family metallopeptidase C-terminal domain-containing protein, partial [Caulobacteraceae bacterium]|nr:M10 family metallopeptidase C-terminal domain-containing protein [Caulobacter sp.]
MSSFTLPAHGGPDAFDREGVLNGKPSITYQEAGEQLDRAGFEWGAALGAPATVTYAFRADLPDPAPAGVAGFTPFTPEQMAYAQLSLEAWSDVANITFVRQGAGTSGAGAYSDDAQILFGGATSLSSQESGVTIPGPNTRSGTPQSIYVNDTETSSTLTPGGFGAHTLTHEIGHSIGLSHPGFYNASDGAAPTYANDALYAEDDSQYSDMSYFNATYTGAYLLNNRPEAPQMDDISAAQRLYGANMTTRTGDDVYGFHSNTDRPWYSLTDPSQTFAATIWDAGGHDTLDFSLYAQDQFLDLREGAFSNVGGGIGNLAIYPGVAIEDAIAGAGNDVVLGNVFANTVLGLGGADSLIGGGGADTLFGNAGNDVIFPGFADPASGMTTTGVAAYGGQGDDVIDARATNAPNLLSGDIGNDTIFSGAGFETVLGGQGDDSLVGGSAAGAGSLQLLFGNQGADTLSYAGGGSVELFGGQDDDVLSVSTSGQGQTHLLFGNLGDDTLTATGGYNSLYGGQGNDVVSVAADGAGHNYLSGDLGADTLTT